MSEAWTRFETAIDSTAGLVAALKNGVDRRVQHRAGIDHRLRGLAEFAHLGYENSWEKVDRLLLSGDEPTHPRNVIYQGRFDDVCVY